VEPACRLDGVGDLAQWRARLSPSKTASDGYVQCWEGQAMVSEQLNIERLERVPLREVWKHEAYDFSSWLAENLDVLNEHLEIPLVSAETEQAAGSFSVDLLAEDESGQQVVIENQLERSDHDHLGKVLTYLASYGAPVAIWIVADPRSEHVAAIAWLNESSPASFYLFKVEAVRIGTSAPAPLLTRIVGPSPETRAIASTKRARGERDVTRRTFWEGLLEYARDHGFKVHAGRTAPHGPYVDGPSGIRGLTFVYGVTQHATRVIFWIDRGEKAEAASDAAYEVLFSRKAEIEAAFGEPLEWIPSREGVRSSKVNYELSGGGWRDEEHWGQIYEATVAAMERFHAAITPHLGAVRDRISSMTAGAVDDEADEELG
jgi:hypothetical protein